MFQFPEVLVFFANLEPVGLGCCAFLLALPVCICSIPVSLFSFFSLYYIRNLVDWVRCELPIAVRACVAETRRRGDSWDCSGEGGRCCGCFTGKRGMTSVRCPAFFGARFVVLSVYVLS